MQLQLNLPPAEGEPLDHQLATLHQKGANTEHRCEMLQRMLSQQPGTPENRHPNPSAVLILPKPCLPLER